MKILYVLDSGQPGGMEYHTLDLVKGMIASGHEVYVWCNEGPISEWFKKTGAEVKTTKIGFDIDPLYIFRLLNFLTMNRIDVLHTHGLKATGNALIAGYLARTKARISHIHTPFTDWTVPKSKKRIYVKAYSMAVNALSTKEIALTNVIMQKKLGEGISIDKLVVIPNGFDEKKFDLSKHNKKDERDEMSKKYDFPKDAFIFGNTSRLSINKGIDNLLKAYKIFLGSLDTKQNPVHLLLAGRGENLEELRKLSEELDLSQHVTFTDTFPEEDHVKLYNSIDAYVFPTHGEGFGLVMIEAMALKIPVVCSDLPVLKEVGGDFVYKYFDSDSVEDISKALSDIFSDIENAKQLAEKSYNYVINTYSLNKFVQNYEELYTSLLA